MRFKKKCQLAFFVPLFSAFIIFLVFYFFDLKINLSPSLPLGIWQEYSCNYKQGDFVSLLAPDNPKVAEYRQNNYCSSIPVFFKEITATENDEIHFQGNFVSLSTNHIFTLPAETELQEGTIPKGYVYLSTDHPKSLDSRYFGIVNTKNLKSCIRLVFEIPHL